MPTDEMVEQARAELHMLNPAAWVLDNQFVNENQQRIEFDLHRFLIQPYADSSPEQAIRKSAQVGWSVLAILKSMHAAKFLKLNGIYTLPTRNASAEFVVPKVNPLIRYNPALAAMVRSTDNKNLKQVGDRFLYFRGVHHEGEAISTTADFVAVDELDRSNQTVVNMMRSRMQYSKYRWFWQFSNPSLPSFGIDEEYGKSDQMHWFMTCETCGYVAFIDFEPNPTADRPNHFLNQLRKIFACGKCGAELSDDMRQGGFWVPKHQRRTVRGYWINQLMVPWVSAAYIMKQMGEMDTQTFYNMVLGLPYQASEFLINREAILNTNRVAVADKTDVAMGCDSGKVKHYVLGNAEGVFAYGKTESWADIERLIRMYNATCVIDALPDFTVPEQLARKYPGQVFVHYYLHDTKNIDTSVQKAGEQFGVIQSDRTKLFDMLASEITGRIINFFQMPKELEELIAHFENIYRIVEDNSHGIPTARWERKPNKPDHFAHATGYYRVAQGLTLRSNEVGGVTPNRPGKKKTSFFVNPQTQSVPVGEALGVEFEQLIEKSLAPHKRRRVQ